MKIKLSLCRFVIFLLLPSVLMMLLTGGSIIYNTRYGGAGRTVTDTIVQNAPRRWQFPSHRDPALQTFYQPHLKFFYETAPPKLRPGAAIAQCYIDHCTEEGARRSGNYENNSMSAQKGCSNYDYQDIIVFQSFFMNGEPGTFVEIGAMTGWGASNTLFFERCLGWTGVLFEASPTNYAQLVKNRASPTTHKIWGTVCDDASQPTEHRYRTYVHNGTGGCCGRVTSIDDTDVRKAAALEAQGYVSLPCKPMAAWLGQADINVTRVDYFSLDTEGYEYEVLRTIDWVKLSVHVLSVEMLDAQLLPGGINGPEFANQQRIRDLLSSVGLTYVPWLSATRGAMNNDEFWVNFSWVSPSMNSGIRV